MPNFDYSPPASCGTMGGMALTYLAAPVLALFAWVSGQCGRSAGLGLDDISLFADPAFLSVSPRCGLAALPLIAAAYLAFTLDSAFQHWRGRGGAWKGRSQALLRSDDDIAPEVDASKTEHGENFPVASLLIAPRLRPPS